MAPSLEPQQQGTEIKLRKSSDLVNGKNAASQSQQSSPTMSTSKKSSAASSPTGSNYQQQQPTTNNNHHRLDKFGFITNMDARGQVVDDDGDSDTDTAGYYGASHNNPRSATKKADGDIPTFQEYKTTQRREKKWGNMMGRWNIPEQINTKLLVPVRDSLLSSGNSDGNTKILSESSMNPDAPQSGGMVQKHIHRRKVITRLRKGVPDHMRGQVWQYLCRVPQRMKEHAGLYDSLVHKAISQHEEAAAPPPPPPPASASLTTQSQQSSASAAPTRPAVPSSPYFVKHAKSFKNIQDTIERDIHRTYPRHHLFYESETQEDDDGEYEDSGFDYEVQAIAEVDSSLEQGSSTVLSSGGEKKSLRNSRSRDSDGGDDGVVLSSPPHNSSNSKRTTPVLRRSHSPSEAPHRPVSPMEEEDNATAGASALDTTDMTDADDDLAFCGNPEISNMIRELEEVVVGESPRNSANNNNASNNNTSSNGDKGVSPSAPHARTPPRTTGHAQLPLRVADAVGGQASLRRVLKAYSVYDREVGYCQGMNFVAGMFLTLMPEEPSFWLLVSVMNDKPCRMRGLFGEGMRETHLVLAVAEHLIAHYLPSISQHLAQEHVHITMFATQWLLTQYTSSFHFDLVLRVWDAFLGEGWKCTYRVMLALLKLYEAQILAGSFEDILALFRELPTLVTGQAVMDMANKIPLKRSTIEKYEAEWHASQLAQAQATGTASPTHVLGSPVSTSQSNNNNTPLTKKDKKKKKRLLKKRTKGNSGQTASAS